MRGLKEFFTRVHKFASNVHFVIYNNTHKRHKGNNFISRVLMILTYLTHTLIVSAFSFYYLRVLNLTRKHPAKNHTHTKAHSTYHYADIVQRKQQTKEINHIHHIGNYNTQGGNNGAPIQ